MTDAPGHFMLPVDESPPRERLSRPMLLAAGAAVLLIHLALFTVFTPLKPEPAAVPRTDRTTLFVSSRVTGSDPLFLKMVDTYDPVSFLHPPEQYGFSFFRISQADSGPEAPFELPLPAKLSPVPDVPQIALSAVSRPLLPDVPDYDPDVVPAAAPAYPYWASSSTGVVFPAYLPGPAEERILQRQHPSEQSVFQVKAPVLPDLPYEAVLERSCGVSELDLAARAWLDTLLNSSDCPAGLKTGGGVCRVVWSAEALRKEASVR
ncbi:MAG: hypothetical protein IJT68_03135 [Lentisphaeria bacterium]|nr:hypothetical protein [Lentisphaeria bacterium]